LAPKTLLVEKEKELGGDCLHFGCVPSKTLIRTAHVYHFYEKFKGIWPSLCRAATGGLQGGKKRIQSVISTIQKHDSEERFCSLGAKVEFGNPTFSDEHTILLNGNTYSAKNWVIATGSSPGIPPIEGLNKTPYITNKEIFSLDHLPESMIVLGAGPIAMEMAQSFGRLGTKVIVIQRSGQILSKEDKDMADEVMNVLSSEGVIFHLNAAIIRTSNKGSEKEVLIKDKNGKEVKLRAEKILVAMGRTPNLKGLSLNNIGVEFDRKGLKVDDRLRTSQKTHICCGRCDRRISIYTRCGI